MSELPQPLNRKPPEQEEAKKASYDFWQNLNPGRILAFTLALLACFIAWVLVTDGADILHRLSDHIFRLFSRARIYPRPNEYFIQLVLIAVFVGWAVRRFKRK